jgi:hypothetical protein
VGDVAAALVAAEAVGFPQKQVEQQSSSERLLNKAIGLILGHTPKWRGSKTAFPSLVALLSHSAFLARVPNPHFLLALHQSATIVAN